MCLNNPSSRMSRAAYLFRRFRPSVSSCTYATAACCQVYNTWRTKRRIFQTCGSG
ncbi:unnamed protein product, partial [Ectocarpus fasciculatus]